MDKKKQSATDSELSLLKVRFEAVMDSMNDGVVLLSHEMKVIDVNKAFVNIFRIQESELSGLQDKDFYTKIFSKLDDDSKEEFSKISKQVLDPTKLIGNLFSVKLVKPREIFLKVYTSPIYDEKQGLIGRIWKFENVNEEKRVDNMKTEFISIASHQLRTPLSTVYGNLDMIMSGDFGEVPEHIKESLTDVRKATKNLIELVNGLLDVSRMEMGKIEPELAEVDLITEVNGILEEFAPMVKTKQLMLMTDKPRSIKIFTDVRLFTEAFKNYLSNAIKYTPQGGNIMITIKDSEDKVYVEMADSGIGIPEKQMDGLFKKFFRADNVLTENFEGTGLGLYYVKKVVEALNGKVGYHPGDMNGSVFWFEIPKESVN